MIELIILTLLRFEKNTSMANNNKDLKYNH